MNVMEESLKMHEQWQGKIEVVSRAKIENAKDLTLAYTPGVAQPCLEIEKDIDKDERRAFVGRVADCAGRYIGEVAPRLCGPIGYTTVDR